MLGFPFSLNNRVPTQIQNPDYKKDKFHELLQLNKNAGIYEKKISKLG